MPLRPGTRLGPYTILEALGAGGMGEVYRAEDARLRRRVAIKILPPHLANPDRLERFEREARAAAALTHPNILTIHDVGRDGDTAWFATELVEGQTIRDLLRAGPIPLKRTIDLARQVAEGLARAHGAGIVHRDLKPENVMVTADGLAKIVDFGIAKSAAAPAVQSKETQATVTALAGTEPALVVGTVGYMSPEQASGRPADYRADQFALGLLIYELVTRTRPFERPTTAQSLVATIEAEPPPIEALKPDVPAHLGAIVTRLLAKNPAERYDSTRDLARDLAAVHDGLSRRTSLVGGGSATATTPVRRFPPRTLGAVAAVLLLVAGAAAVWLWRDRPTVPAPGVEPERPLVAVRAFRSFSADPRQAYFAAGMTEEIRGKLSQIASLRVLSGSGLDAYGDDMVRAARELDLRSFVDGSVRVDGGHVRVSAELVHAGTRETLWSEQYDRELADVLAVQGEIAQQIARALSPSLSASEQARVEKRPTDNLEAYTLYLKVQQGMPSVERERNLEAIELLRKALALDPGFAQAQARIAYRTVFMGYYDDPSWIDKGIAEAEAALRIDPELPAAHFTLGTAYAMKGHGPLSRQAFLRAVELDPSGGGILTNFSLAEMQYGRLDEAVYLGRRSFLLSGKRGFYHLVVPMLFIRADDECRVLLAEAERRADNSRVQMLLAMLDVLEGRNDRAVERSTAVVERQPQNIEALQYRSNVAYLLDADDLEARLAPLIERSPTSRLGAGESNRMRYAYALRRRGDAARSAALVAEAERFARERIEAGDDTPAQRIELAAAAALRADAAAALEWLEKAIQAGYREYGFLERAPIFRPLASDARFRDLLDRMRRDVDAQRERARARGLLELESLL
ncbi:MAG TPA: protein kinase [Vicinamibacterales bacterium]|nr:protein kinase [Vicinamibacterales bacterium]